MGGDGSPDGGEPTERRKGFRSFEDIGAWQKARVLAREVYRVSGEGQFRRDLGLREQVRRAAVSVVSNIAEGFERDGSGDFLHFLAMAKGSVGEVRAQLYVALDQGYITRDAFTDLVARAAEVSRMVAGLMAYLRRASPRIR
jgi:four helix bundle protein